MRRVRSMIALLLLALWLPATLHCELEAARLLSHHGAEVSHHHDDHHHHHDDDDANHHEADHGWHVMVKTATKPSGTAQKAPPPSQLFVYFLPDFPVAGSSPVRDSMEVKVAVQRPMDWVPAWHFVRRAAPGPRAPSVAV